jgi:hypothetical protein
VPGVLQKALIADLSQSIAPASSGSGTNAPADCWIITGEFLEVDTGSRALQAGVGFGAGQSHLEVRAKVYSAHDPNRPFLTFDSEGASGHMPGAVMTKNPYVAAAKFVMRERAGKRGEKSRQFDRSGNRQIHGCAGNSDTKIDENERRNTREGKPLGLARLTKANHFIAPAQVHVRAYSWNRG